jgi:hypothetical protein
MIGLTVHADVKGATFSEVMVAMALVAVSVMGALGAFEAADKNLARDALAARALSMAESRLEAKRATPWGQMLAEDLDHDGVPDLTMRDDGTGGDRMPGDGIYSAMLEQHGVTVVWTVASRHSESLVNSGAVLIEARGVYRANGGEREVRLATLRANPAFAGNH